MSRYEWERGEFTLPSAAYPKFRKELITAWNTWQEEIYKTAKAIVPLLRRGPGKDASMSDRLDFGTYYWLVKQPGFSQIPEDTGDLALRLIRKEDGKYLMPMKKDLNIFPVSKQCVLQLGEGMIQFVDKTRLVVWSVMENNHACERARQHPIAKIFFKKLGQVQWVRGTGGTIIGNDEYNRGNEYEGQGANYTKETYDMNAAKRRAEEDRKFSMGRYAYPRGPSLCARRF